jgi:hypothetical protein
MRGMKHGQRTGPLSVEGAYGTYLERKLNRGMLCTIRYALSLESLYVL